MSRLILERDKLGRFIEVDEPEPCGPHCPCWQEADFWPYGYCKKDDPEFDGAIARGEYSAWKERFMEENYDPDELVKMAKFHEVN